MRVNTFKTFGFFVALMAISVGVSAQPAFIQRPMDSAFLLELAQRLVARGEYAEARGILDKVSQIEPDNAAVQELLAKVEKAPSVKVVPTINARDIASDIAAIQKNIQRYERRNRDMEFLIRQLVQENDILSKTLARRNRSLLDLMKKVYGEGAELPEVVLDSQHSQQILSGYQDQIAQRDRELVSRNQELSHIVQQINQVNDSLKNNELDPVPLSREQTAMEDAQHLSRDLKEKRGYLVDKSLALMGKSRDLQLLQSEMTTFSGTLKDADDKYAAAIKEYDAKIETLKESWAADKSNQQAEIHELRDQLITKTKELQRHQSAIAAQAPALSERKEGLARTDRAIAQTDADILSKDMQILKLKGLLTEKDGMIALQHNKLAEKSALIGFVDDTADDLKKRVVRIRQSLSDGDRALQELKARVTVLKDRAQGAPQAPIDSPDLKAQLNDWKRQLDQALKTLQDQEGVTAQLKTKLDQNADALEQKEIALTRRKRIADEFEAQLQNARDSEKATKDELNASRRKMEMLLENLSSYKANATTASERASNLSEKVYDLEDRLQEEVTQTAQEAGFLKETLAERDQEVVAIKKELLTKDDQLKYFYRKMDDATKSLNANTLSRDRAPTDPSWSLTDSDSSGGAAPWDPKNNDAYALQQRLAIAAKEVQTARQQMAEKEAQRHDLETKLAAKEQQLLAQKEDYSKLLTAENAQEQSKKWRARDTSVRAEQLTETIAQSQQQLDFANNHFKMYKKSADQMSAELKANTSQMKELIVKLERKNKELTEYKMQVKEKDEQIELQKKAIEHETQRFENLKRTLDDANKLVRLGQGRFGDKDLSIQDLKDSLNNAKIRERDYKSRIKDMERHLRESYQMVKQGEDRLAALKEQLAGKENRMAALHKELTRLQKLLRPQNTKLP